MKRSRAIFLVLALAAVAIFACDRYTPPPTPTIAGLTGGTLQDPAAPLTIDFGKAIDPASLALEVAYLETDLEGNLYDEDDDDNTTLRTLFVHNGDVGDQGGRVDFDPNGSVVRVVPNGPFPVGPKLVLLVEAGLKATDGRTLNYRVRVPFSYLVKCGAGQKANQLASGVYFMLLDVEQPLGVQIQILADIHIDPATGVMVGQFTNADRNSDPSRCPTPCGSSDVCRLLPAPASCVPPSTKAGTVDEFSDFVPNATPPIGYSFLVEGCAVDGDAGAALLTAPASMIVQSPPVTIAGLVMTAFFESDGRATGSLTADTVSLSNNPIGAGKGTMTAIRLAPEQVPPGIPAPPDGGVDASP
jgi:hypothetical protein